MKIIQLTQGQEAIVDDDVFEHLNQWRWCAHSNGRDFYAVRTAKHKTISMHSLIVNVPAGMIVDHVNHNTLDNRRENLRVATPSQNKMNRGVQSTNQLGVKGVSPNGSGFRAYVVVGGKYVFDKTFRTLEEAKSAYEREARKYHGEYFHQ